MWPIQRQSLLTGLDFPNDTFLTAPSFDSPKSEAIELTQFKFISVKIKPNLICRPISYLKKLNVQERVNTVQSKFHLRFDLYFPSKHALRVCRIFTERQTLYVLQFQTVHTAPPQYICFTISDSPHSPTTTHLFYNFRQSTQPHHNTSVLQFQTVHTAPPQHICFTISDSPHSPTTIHLHESRTKQNIFF
jgi:hypothetical protein